MRPVIEPIFSGTAHGRGAGQVVFGKRHAECIIAVWYPIGHMQRVFSFSDVLLATRGICSCCLASYLSTRGVCSPCLTSYWPHSENSLAVCHPIDHTRSMFSLFHPFGPIRRIFSLPDIQLVTRGEYCQCMTFYGQHVENTLAV
jgi:hypothetical protein